MIAGGVHVAKLALSHREIAPIFDVESVQVPSSKQGLKFCGQMGSVAGSRLGMNVLFPGVNVINTSVSE